MILTYFLAVCEPGFYVVSLYLEFTEITPIEVSQTMSEVLLRLTATAYRLCLGTK